MVMTELQRERINVVGRIVNVPLIHTGVIIGGSFDQTENEIMMTVQIWIAQKKDCLTILILIGISCFQPSYILITMSRVELNWCFS